MSGTFGRQFFDVEYYLQQNTDVLSAISTSAFQGDAWDHFQQYGRFENRMPNENFNPAQYLAANPDVLAAVNARVIASAWDHFVTWGMAEGRAAGTFAGTFDEAAYLAANPDVAAAVGPTKDFVSGYQHYLLYGQAEGRAASNTAGDQINSEFQTFVLTTDAPSVTEGDTGQKALTFTLTLDRAPTEAVTVNYQTLTTGTATAGDDFGVAAGAVTFAVGQTAATVTVNVLGDTAVEANETVKIEFSGASLAAAVTATGTITNNDTVNAPIGAVSDTNGAAGGSVAESAAVGAAVGITASATDATAGETVSYALTTNPGNLFAVDAATGVVTVAGALDYETAASHSITVQATSSDGSTSSNSFTIAVTDVAEDVGALTDSNAAADSVAENVAVGTVVGITASATDPQAGDTVSYALTVNPGNLFAIDAATGVVTVAGALDHETAASHGITVQATSSDGSTSSNSFTIAVTDVVEAQTFALTTGTDTGAAFTGADGNDIFTAGEVAGAATFTVGDALNGGAGIDTLNIFSEGTVNGVPAGASVLSVENVNVTSGASVVINTASGFTGTTALAVNHVGSATVTASETTAITVTGTLGNGTATVNGGSDVTVTETSTTSGGTITIGNTKAALGTVTVNSAQNASGATAAGINVMGGSTIAVTQTQGNAVNSTNTNGVVSVLGNASTTDVTVTNAAATTKSATVAGVTANTVTIEDVNAGSTTAAGTITSATVSNFTTLNFAGNALTTLSVTGGSGNIIIDNAGLTTPTNTTLDLTISGQTGGTLDDADIYTTLNVTTSGTASTLANLTFGAATALNVAGDKDLKLTSTAGLSKIETVAVSGSAGLTANLSSKTLTSLTSVDTSATTGSSTITIGGTTTSFTGGAGVDTVTVLSTTIGGNIALGGGDETFNVTSGTTAITGSLDGGNGTDTLVMDAADAAAVSASAANVAGFEVLSLGQVAGGSSLTVDLANLGDISTLVSAGTTEGGTETADVTFNALLAGQSITIAGRTVTATTGAATDAQVAAAFLTGQSDNDLQVAGQLTGWTAAAGNSNTTVTFTSTTPDSNEPDLTVTGSGVADPVLSAPSITQGTLSTPEVAEFSFSQGLNIGQSITIAGRIVTATTGAATDAQVAAAFLNGQSTNNLQVAGQLTGWTAAAGIAPGVVAFTATQNSNVNDLAATTAGTAAPTAPTLNVTQGAADGTLTVTNMASGGTLELTGAINGASSVAVTNAATGTADVLNIKMASATTAITNTAALTVADVETVNILTDDTAETTTNITHVAELAAAAATTITVTGDAGLNLTYTGTALTTFDASDVTGGAVTLTAAGALTAAATITGSATQDNTITTKATNTAITYTGGTGVDTITFGDGDNVIDVGAGTNTVTAGDGDNGVTGGADVDTVTLEDGDNTISTFGEDDVIVVGNGSNTIVAGEGDDTITVGTGLNTITLGAGDDTVNVSRAANANIYSMITDFAVGDSLDFSIDATAGVLGSAIILAGTATFVDYLNTAASGTTGNSMAWFQFGGDTFVVADDNLASTFITTGNAGDSVVGLTGLVDLAGTSVDVNGVLTFVV